jgi:hypothetical protein
MSFGEWQPIETAPKDGRLILGFQKPHVEMCFYSDRQLDFIVVNAPPEYNFIRLTHWMPLPKPPKE